MCPCIFIHSHAVDMASKHDEMIAQDLSMELSVFRYGFNKMVKFTITVKELKI